MVWYMIFKEYGHYGQLTKRHEMVIVTSTIIKLLSHVMSLMDSAFVCLTMTFRVRIIAPVMTQSDAFKVIVMPQLKLLLMEPLVEFLPVPFLMVLLQEQTTWPNYTFTHTIVRHRNRLGYILLPKKTALKRCNEIFS